eukprot:364852-Chlamydomonas_euryale.AAC.3
MSATVSEDVERLTKLVLHSPVVLNLLNVGASLASGSGSAVEIEHFAYDCAQVVSDDSQHCLPYSLFRQRCTGGLGSGVAVRLVGVCWELARRA